MSEKIFRYISIDGCMRAVGDGRTIGGYVAVYGKETVLGNGQREVIMPGAFDGMLRDVANGVAHIYALFNHNKDMLLGSTRNGSLRLSSDQVGLYAEIDLPETTVGNDVLAGVRSGLYSGGSFHFLLQGLKTAIVQGVRQLRQLRLSEVTVTGTPAYSDTNMALVRAWGMDDIELPTEESGDNEEVPNGLPALEEPDVERTALHDSIQERLASFTAARADYQAGLQKQLAAMRASANMTPEITTNAESVERQILERA